MKKVILMLLVVSPMWLAAQSSTSDEVKRKVEAENAAKTGVPNLGNSTQSSTPAGPGRGMGEKPGLNEKEIMFYGELVVVSDGKKTKIGFVPAEDYINHFFTKEDLEMINRVTTANYTSLSSALTFLSGNGWEYVSQYESLENGVKGQRIIVRTISRAKVLPAQTGAPAAPGTQGTQPTRPEKGTGSGTGNGGATITPKK